MTTKNLVNEGLELLEGQGEADAAAEKFQAALDQGARGREAAEARIGLARVRVARGDIQAASEEARKALQTDAGYGEAYTMEGLLAEIGGDPNAALAQMRRGGELAPDSFLAQYNLARLLYQLDKPAEALPHYEKAVQLAPDSPHARMELAAALFATQKVERALREAAETLERNPGLFPAEVLLAQFLVSVGDAKRAEPLLREALERKPDHPLSLSLMVDVRLAAGRLDEALTTAKQWAKADPRDPQAAYQLATLLIATGDLEAAELEARRLETLLPDNWNGPYLLGTIYDATKRIEEAKQSYARAASLGPQEWKPFNNLGMILLEEEDPASVRKGVDHLQEAAGLSKNQPEVLYNLALGLIKLGDRQQGIKIAQQVATGDSKLAEQARRLLSKLSS